MRSSSYEISRDRARSRMRTGGRANHSWSASGASRMSKYEEASRFDNQMRLPGATQTSRKAAGFPSLRGFGGGAQRSEMTPPCHMGRCRSWPGLPTMKKEPTPRGDRVNPIFPQFHMRRRSLRYSGPSAALMRTLSAPIGSAGTMSATHERRARSPAPSKGVGSQQAAFSGRSTLEQSSTGRAGATRGSKLS